MLIYQRRRLPVIFLAFLAATFLVGIAGALQFPTLSRFLTEEIRATSVASGVFYSVNASVAIVVGFFLSLFSDKRGKRKQLILFCCAMALTNNILFAFSRQYIVLLTLGVSLAAVASNTLPQLFALAREFAERSARDVVMFTTVMRAQMSLAWVIGPPLSFMLAINYGFTVMYLCAAGLFLLAIIVIYFTLPAITQQPASPITSAEVAASALFKDKDIVLLFLASMLMWTCNTMYLIDMPLYTVMLGLDKNLAGILMGTAAGLEIPIMILSGMYVKKSGKRKAMLFAVLCGALFHWGLINYQTQSMLIALQLLNALFIGVIAGIGMLYFQDLLPNRPGTATTMFTNSALMGTILAGLIQGNIVENSGHFAVYWVTTGLMILAFILCSQVREA